MAYRLTTADRRALAQMRARELRNKNGYRAVKSTAPKAQTSGNVQVENKKNEADAGTIALHTAGDLGSDILAGAAKFGEGIVDWIAGANIVSRIGSLISDDYKNAIKDFVEVDWVGKIADPVDEYFEHSITNGSKGGQIAEAVAQGVGQMLPGIIATVATGGSTSGTLVAGTVQTLNTIALATSAAGNATEEAWKDGADYNEGLAYGAVSGGIEAATEKLLPGVGDIVIGKPFLKGFSKGAGEVAQQGGKRILRQAFANALNEGAEEMVSEVTNPLRKTIYKGKDVLKEYGEGEFWAGVGEAGVVGALTSVAMTPVGGLTNKALGRNADIDASLEKVQELNKKKSLMQRKGTLTNEAEAQIDASIEANLKQIESVLGKADANTRAKYMESYKQAFDNRFSDDGVLNEKAADTSGLDKQYYSVSARGHEAEIKASLDREGVKAYHGELTEQESNNLREVYQAHEKLNELGYAGKHVVIVESMEKSNAFLDKNIIAIGKDMLENGEHIKKLIHETTHFTEGSKEWHSVAKFVFGKDTKNIRTALKAELDLVLNSGYGVTQADVDAVIAHIESGYETKLTEKQGLLIQEVVANRMEKMFGDMKSIERLCRENKSIARQIWERIKALIEVFGKSHSEREEIKKLRETERLFRAALETGGQDYIRGEIENAAGEATTGIQFSKKISEYPYDMQHVIKDYLESVDSILLEKAKEHKADRTHSFERIEICDVDEDLAKQIGDFFDRDYIGSSVNINSNAFNHIEKRHGENGQQDSSMQDLNDVARIGYVIKNRDSIEPLLDEKGNQVFSSEFGTKDNTPAPLVIIKKKINGTYYCVLAASDSKYKKIWVQTAFINKKDGLTQVLRAEIDDLGVTSETPLASHPSVTSISQNSEKSTPETKKSRKVQHSYKGRNAADADMTLLERAEAMEAEGAESEAIRKETGWFKSFDGEWRYEIDDSKMRYLNPTIDENGFTTLGELIEHDALFEAYPQLRDLKVEVKADTKYNYYSPGRKKIVLMEKVFENGNFAKIVEKTYGGCTVLIHEIQHAIQHIEGFARGTSPSEWRQVLRERRKKVGVFVKGKTKKAVQRITEKYGDEVGQDARRYIDLAILEGRDKITKAELEELDVIEFDLEMILGEDFDIIDKALMEEAEYINSLRSIKGDADLNYYNTAGEIEAYDVGERVDLDAEARRAVRPDIDRDPDDVKFADPTKWRKMHGEDAGEKKSEAKAFSEVTIWNALSEAFDHDDAGYDNLIKLSKMPKYITGKFGIEGEIYIYRNHAYENMVSEDDAREAGRPITRGGKKIHFHNFGMQKMADALLSIENPIMAIDDTTKEGNPTVLMILSELGNNEAPLYAVFSFYNNQNINGSFERKPHIMLTIAEREYFGTENRDGWAELIERAIKENRVLDYNKNKGHALSVIAQHTRLGNITEASLNDSISQFRKKINTFKQKNKIQYSRKSSDNSGGYAVNGAELMRRLDIGSDLSLSNAESDARRQRDLLQAEHFPGMSDEQVVKAIRNMTRKKVYSHSDAVKVSEDIARLLVFEDDYGLLQGKGNIIENIWKLYNASGRSVTREAALKIADSVLESAVLGNIYEVENLEPYMQVLDILRPYMHTLDLSEYREEIKHVYGNKNSLALIWGKREGGVTPDMIVDEIRGQGVPINSEAPADILFEIHELYAKARDTIREATKRHFEDALPDTEREKLRNRLAKAVMDGYKRLGSYSAIERASNAHRAEVKKLEEDFAKEFKAMQLELTDKVRELRYKVQANDIKNSIIKQVSDIRDLKKEAFLNATQYESHTFRTSIERLSSITRANFSTTVSRQVFADLKKWYNKENPMLYKEGLTEDEQVYRQRVADMLDAICSGEGEYTIAQLKCISSVIGHFKKLMQDYDKTFIDGEYVDIAPMAEKFVEINKENENIPSGMIRKLIFKYRTKFDDPMALMRLLDGYQDGYCTQLYEQLRRGVINAEVWKMQIYKRIDEFMDKHKGFKKSLSKKTVKYTVDGKTYDIPLNQAMYLYMTMKREDAILAHGRSGFEYRNKDGKYTRVDGCATDTRISDDEVGEVVARSREAFYERFTDSEKEFISLIEQIFNEDCKNAKAETDLKRDGFPHVKEGYYVPIAVTDVAHSIDGGNMFLQLNSDLGAFSFNKSTVKGQKHELRIQGLTDVFDRHLSQVAVYSNIALTADSFSRIFHYDVGGNSNKVQNVKSSIKNIWDGAEGYIKDIYAGIKGKQSDTPKWIKQLRSGYAKFALGGNLKVPITQFSSLFAAINVLDIGCITAGISVKGKADVDKYCALAELRNYDNSAAMAQSVLDRSNSIVMGKVDKIGDVLMKHIGLADRGVVKWLWGACQLQVEKNSKLKVGTEENKVEAGKLLEKVILETQQNSLLTERSAAMRGNFIYQTVTMFSADAMKVIGRVYDAYGMARFVKYRLKNAKSRNASQAEIDKLEAELKKAHGMEARAVASLASTSVMMYLIGLLFKFLYNKLDDEYEEGDAAGIAMDAFTQTLGNMLGGLPIIKDIYSKLTDGYDIDNYAYSAINDLIDGFSNLYDAVAGGDERELGNRLKNLSFSVGQVLGIPTRNIYNTLYGLTKRFSPSSAYKWDNVLGKQSYSADLQKAIEKDDEDMIETITGLILDESLGAVSDKAVRGEVSKLSASGYSVLPRSIGDKVTYDGEEIVLTKKQKARFKELYAVGNQSAAELVKLPLYKKADEQASAKALKFIYDTYYNLALQETLGLDLEGKNVLFAEALDIEQLAIIVGIASTIEADVDRKGNVISGSRKAKLEKYVESLPLKAAQKYMIMGYLGYKNKNGEAQVKAYISRLSLTKDEKAQLLEYSGYAA